MKLIQATKSRLVFQLGQREERLLLRERMEKAEHYVHQLLRYSLHATMERDE